MTRRVLPDTVEIIARINGGERQIVWSIYDDSGTRYQAVIPTGVMAGEEWTLMTTHRTMLTFAMSVAESVQKILTE